MLRRWRVNANDPMISFKRISWRLVDSCIVVEAERREEAGEHDEEDEVVIQV